MKANPDFVPAGAPRAPCGPWSIPVVHLRILVDPSWVHMNPLWNLVDSLRALADPMCILVEPLWVVVAHVLDRLHLFRPTEADSA